jgi:hypothetical protein
MTRAGSRLRVVLAEHCGDYVRHARRETLRAINFDPHPDLVEPMPYAVYLLAYDETSDAPIGLAEACFLQQHYASIDDVPYAPYCKLQSFCLYPQLSSIRTVYVEPHVRLHRGLYPKLILAMAAIFQSLGSRYAAATTNAGDRRLSRLYDRTGGTRAATFSVPAYSADPIALYLFELDALLRHPAVPEMKRELEVEADVLQTVRARSRFAVTA